jgi:ribose transport system permease protein
VPITVENGVDYMNNNKTKSFGKSFTSFCRRRPAIIFFIVYIISALLFVPKFANLENLGNILVQSSDLIILACGMTFVFLNGGIDFSVVSVLALTSVIGSLIMTSGGNIVIMIPVAIIAMFGVGILIGIINGISVTRLKMPSFIATMSSQLIFSGIALTITQSDTIGNVPREFNLIAQGTFKGMPIPNIITIVVVIIMAYLLHGTIFGRYIFSVGTNHKASNISGIPVKQVILRLFIISSVMATLASIIMTARLGAGIPSLGKDMLMDIVAAVVIGGTSVTGGEGNIFGTVVGAILVGVLNNSLNLLGADWFIINVCKGIMILFVALFDVIRNRSH